jgi:XTP/dITP diphosphohydrolase
MMTLLVATTNAGKWREVRATLAGLALDLRSLADLPPASEPEETGLTFADNALLKARYWARRAPPGWLTVAEDSGLEIDALGGAPGVRSARYPGEAYADKFANLYRALAGHPQPWTARYTCALAMVDKAGRVRFACETCVEGEINAEPRGEYGFGYDPIFRYPDYGRTFGEATDAEKLAVSHRGRAFRELAAWLAANG